MLQETWIIFALVLVYSYSAKVVRHDVVYPTNLLFVMFDDLRPELSNYGRSHMITPNFERLAKRSVTFDYAFTHIAVCNPARDAIMTGLRPDSVGTYGFQHSFSPHITFPTQLAQSGYNTAGFGKVLHWDGDNKKIWNYASWANDWYVYQEKEWGWLNSSTMPDKIKREEDFRDYEFTTKAIATLKKMVKEPKYFMLGIGYKLPHLTLHVPYKYYKMYKGKSEAWKLNKKELRFPNSVGPQSYRCCGMPEFQFMNEEGGLRFNRSIPLGDINNPFTDEMHDEIMMGYSAAVSFVDAQLGRLLDALDELELWHNITVILSADHGMHNGEKGIWEKWTLFEEAVRVPLMIAHPLSPYKGQHYKEPVESVDIYATVNEILQLPSARSLACAKKGRCKVKALQGKSLAPVVLGKKIWDKSFKYQKDWDSARLGFKSFDNNMPVMNHNFSISQWWKCALSANVTAGGGANLGTVKRGTKANLHTERFNPWYDCNVDKKDYSDETSLMGYSMRTPDYRYTAYFYYNRTTERPDLEQLPYEQELFDHRNETERLHPPGDCQPSLSSVVCSLGGTSQASAGGLYPALF